MLMYDKLFTSTLSALAVSVLLVAPAGAGELYKYRDVTGRLVLSNMPPPVGAQVEAQHEALPPVEVPREPVEATRPAPSPPPVVTAASAETPGQREKAPTPREYPVDTTELALTSRGQSAARVRERLGTPAQVVTMAPLQHVELLNGQYQVITVERELWVYAGNSQVGEALVLFHNGSVRSADRRR